MGFKDSFVAVQGRDRATVLQALGADPVGSSSPSPEHPHLVELPDSWIVVVGEHGDSAFEPRMQALTRLGPAVAASLYESVMYSEARGYRDGRECWRVTWDPELELDEPATSGELPDAYPALLAAAHERQAAERAGDDEVDEMFDLPLDLAHAVCGFKFGEDISQAPPWEPVFEPRPTPVSQRRPGFFARLFGRG